jgi:hypothetical protein
MLRLSLSEKSYRDFDSDSSVEHHYRERWSPPEIALLSAEATRINLNPYPSYIAQARTKHSFKNLKLEKEFSRKQISDKFYEYVSPKSNRNPLTKDEIEAVREYKLLHPEAKWSKFAKHLFELNGDPNGSYRPAGFLKNHKYDLFKKESQAKAPPAALATATVFKSSTPKAPERGPTRKRKSEEEPQAARALATKIAAPAPLVMAVAAPLREEPSSPLPGLDITGLLDYFSDPAIASALDLIDPLSPL